MKNLLYMLILLLGFPVGYYLAYITKDEIKKWRGRLIGLGVVCLISAVGISFTGFGYKFPSMMSLFFMLIVNLVVVWKSY